MSKSSTAARRLPNREAALEALYSDISAKGMFPFWATSTDVADDEIKQLMGTQKAVPHRWSYKNDIEPILFRAAELVTMDDSERRSLILVNPGLSPRRATVSTMYTAYRLNDANEVMPPHRHSPNAIRFGLTGNGNFTGVGGEDITFGPGDMVLTPVDTWHNHGNVGNEPAINLSVLDLPLVETLNAVYFEHDYTEMVDGKPVKKKQQTAAVPRNLSRSGSLRACWSLRSRARDTRSSTASVSIGKNSIIWQCPVVPGSSTSTATRNDRRSCSSPATSRR